MVHLTNKVKIFVFTFFTKLFITFLYSNDCSSNANDAITVKTLGLVALIFIHKFLKGGISALKDLGARSIQKLDACARSII